MKKLLMLLTLLFGSFNVFSQQAIPDFINNVRYAGYIDTLLKNNVKDFDLIIALRTHYSWKYESEYHLLVHNNGHWQKIVFRNKRGSLALYDRPKVVPTKLKAECDTLYAKLLANNLFTIEDDQVYPVCLEVDTVINNKHRKFSIGIDNAAGYSIWIITPKKSRQLYYYAPEYFIRYCMPYWDRRNAIDIITLLSHDW